MFNGSESGDSPGDDKFEFKGDGPICYVTVGATASFNQLLEAVLHQPVIDLLHSLGFRGIIVQYGETGSEHYRSLIDRLDPASISQTKVWAQGQAFYPSLTEIVMSVRTLSTGRPRAIVISHAGSGTILECMRLHVPIVVVPNTSLADNHQVELAEELARQGYVVHGDLLDIPGAIQQAVSQFDKPLTQPWVQNGKVAAVLDEEMAFLD